MLTIISSKNKKMNNVTYCTNYTTILFANFRSFYETSYHFRGISVSVMNLLGKEFAQFLL